MRPTINPGPDEDRPRREALAELAGQWPTYGYRRMLAGEQTPMIC